MTAAMMAVTRAGQNIRSLGGNRIRSPRQLTCRAWWKKVSAWGVGRPFVASRQHYLRVLIAVLIPLQDPGRSRSRSI